MFKKILITFSLVFGLIGLVSFAHTVNAASLTAGPLNISYDGTGPIFSESNVSPGGSYTKDITVTNNGTVSHSFALATTNVTGDLSGQMYIEPTVNGSSVWKTSIYELDNLPTESKTVVSSIAPGDSVTVTLKAMLDEMSGDSYQDKNVSFDLVFGTEEAEPSAGSSPTGDAGGTTGGFAGLTTLGAGDAGTAGELPSATPSASPSATPEGGEVLGAQNETDHGFRWEFLLIVPVIGILAIAFLPISIEAAILVPTVSGATTAAIAPNYIGGLKPWIFWLILIIEVILFFFIKYYRWLRKLARKTAKEVKEEVKKVEKKIEKGLK